MHGNGLEKCPRLKHVSYTAAGAEIVFWHHFLSFLDGNRWPGHYVGRWVRISFFFILGLISEMRRLEMWVADAAGCCFIGLLQTDGRGVTPAPVF